MVSFSIRREESVWALRLSYVYMNGLCLQQDFIKTVFGINMSSLYETLIMYAWP